MRVVYIIKRLISLTSKQRERSNFQYEWDKTSKDNQS